MLERAQQRRLLRGVTNGTGVCLVSDQRLIPPSVCVLPTVNIPPDAGSNQLHLNNVLFQDDVIGVFAEPAIGILSTFLSINHSINRWDH